MKEYKYIYFVEGLLAKTKTSVWSCRSNSSTAVLGFVKWYAPWRQYCYFPDEDAVYSAGCLDDISDFIKSAMEDRKISIKEGRG